MQKKLIGKLAEWRYSTATVILLFISFSPYLLFDFAFHNDFEIWAYDNKVCCSGFPETPHLIRIGRFLQAFLQNVYLSTFTDLKSLVFGRALGIAFACIGAIMLAAIARKNGMGRLSSAAFGIAAFLLPPAQVNLAWITNFIPGLFNAVLVLYTAILFPEVQAVLKQEKFARAKLFLSGFLLLAALYIYPPTAGFFLLPALIRITYRGFAKVDVKTHALFAFSFFGLICLVYFFLHRVVYMRLFDITFPEASLYRFDISNGLWSNFTKFFHEIFPVMLNLWNPAPAPAVAAFVVLMLVVPGAYLIYRNRHSSPPRVALTGLAVVFAAWAALFFAANAPGLVAIGQPPTFYRAWHPGMVAVMLLLFRSIDTFRLDGAKNGVLFAIVLIGCGFSFNSSMFLATTLSKQFGYAVSQISAQFSPPERERYVIVEKRPPSLLLGRPRWGELGFVHILSRGHGIYILKKYFDYGIHPIIESVVAKQAQNQLLLEPEFLEKANLLFPRAPTEPRNKSSDQAFDFRVDTFFEKSGPLPTTLDIVGSRPAAVQCYKIHAGIQESPSRSPRSWRLSGSNDDRTWVDLDSQSNQTAWREGESRSFVPQKHGDYKHYRFEVDSSNQDGIVRVAEMQLFTRESACHAPEFPQMSAVNPNLLKSLASSPDEMSVSLAGIATESGLSDPPFRLQRAFDNIYYTFWETLGLFPIDVDIRFFENKRIMCYAFQAGDDKANARMPKSWKLLGSNDLRHWDVLDTRDNESKWTDNSRREYPVSSPGPYRSYRIEFLSTNGGRFLRLYEMALSEDRECTHTIP